MNNENNNGINNLGQSGINNQPNNNQNFNGQPMMNNQPMNNQPMNNQGFSEQSMMNNQPMNNQGFNEQPMMNNQPNNNQYNNYNNYNGNSDNKKKNNKTFIIIGVIAIVVLGSIVLNSLFKKGSSNVDYTCTMTNAKDNINQTLTIKGTFDYKDSSGTIYQLYESNELVAEYTNGLTDSEYTNFTNKTFGTYCKLDNVDCSSSHFKLTSSSLGFDTVVDRNNNKIVITYIKYMGIGSTISKSEKDSLIDSYKQSGMTCKY